MNNFFKVIVTKINKQTSSYNGMKIPAYFNNIQEMYQETDTIEYFNIIVKSERNYVEEIVSRYKFFILENENKSLLATSLKQLKDLINQDKEIYFVRRSDLNTYRKIPTNQEINNYIMNFYNCEFAKEIHKPNSKTK